MVKTTLYILCGLPYSGKTTLTNQLVQRFGFNVTSMDNIINEKHMHPATMTQEDWNQIYSEGYERLKKNLQEGLSVILDLGNLKLNERDTARTIAKSLGVSSKLVYINTPTEDILARRLKNQTTRERGHLTDASMNLAIEMFQEPTELEKPVIYNAKMNLDEWVRKNIND